MEKAIKTIYNSEGDKTFDLSQIKDVNKFFIDRAESYAYHDGLAEYTDFAEIMKEKDFDIAIGDTWEETAEIPLLKVGDKILVAQAPVDATFKEAAYFDGEEVQDPKIGRTLAGEWKLAIVPKTSYYAVYWQFDKDGNRVNK